MATDELFTATSTAVAGAAVLLGTLAVAFCASPRAGLHVFLDLLLAAGLLRLATADTWTAIATAAAVVAIRRVAVGRLRFADAPTPARQFSTPDGRSESR
jgi:hypothetical protein